MGILQIAEGQEGRLQSAGCRRQIAEGRGQIAERRVQLGQIAECRAGQIAECKVQSAESRGHQRVECGWCGAADALSTTMPLTQCST
jgi:hypothetical protein